jgi:creatinine amidohydrolase
VTSGEWARLPWPAFSVATPATVGLLPVGATEQHGPHLPTGTDSLIAEGLCRAAAERAGAVVLPTISVGCSYGHGTRLPGTISLTPEQLSDLVRTNAEWAARSGITRLLVVNAHYGNRAAIGTAVDHLRLERPDLRVGASEWWDLDPALTTAMLADGADVHANRAETSVVLALAPELVDLDAMATADDPDRTGDLVFRYTADRLSTNGVTGRPSEASKEEGLRLVELAVAALADLVRRGAEEEPPLP